MRSLLYRLALLHHYLRSNVEVIVFCVVDFGGIFKWFMFPIFCRIWYRKYLNVYVILQLQNVTNFNWNLVHFNLYQIEGRSSLVRQLNFTILTFSHHLMYMYAKPCSILESLQQLRGTSNAYKLCLLKMTSACIAYDVVSHRVGGDFNIHESVVYVWRITSLIWLSVVVCQGERWREWWWASASLLTLTDSSIVVVEIVTVKNKR